jgi:AcrR family transcriptional regulator
VPTSGDILDAAERIHRDQGLAALSVRRVAEAVGVTPMALYKHFADKDDLLNALVARGFERLETYFAVAAAKRTPVNRIRAALTQYREFALAEPRMFELMFLVPRRGVPPAPDSLRQSPSPSATLLIAAVAACIQSGEITADEPAEVLLLLWATVHGLIALHISGRFGGDAERFRKIFDAVVRNQFELLLEPPRG